MKWIKISLKVHTYFTKGAYYGCSLMCQLGQTELHSLKFPFLYVFNENEPQDGFQQTWRVEVKQKLFYSRYLCCLSAGSPHWCKVVARPVTALPSQGSSFSLIESQAKGLFKLRDQEPQFLQDTHTTQVRGSKNTAFHSLFS